MRVLTCLSHNVSMAQEKEERSQRRRLWLNFKRKKRRTEPYGERRPFPSSDVSQRSAQTDLSTHVNDENIPPTCGYIPMDLNSDLPQEANDAKSKTGRRVSFANNVTQFSGTSAALDPSISSRSFKRRETQPPLPPIPTEADASIYIKEIETTASENDTDYLPLRQVFPALRSDDSQTSTEASTAIYDIPRAEHSYEQYDMPPLEARRLYASCLESTQECSTCRSTDLQEDSSSKDNQAGSSVSCDSDKHGHIASDTRTRQNCVPMTASSSSTVIARMKSVGSFNEAFIQSTGSLALRTVSGASVAAFPYNNNNKECIRLQLCLEENKQEENYELVGVSEDPLLKNGGEQCSTKVSEPHYSHLNSVHLETFKSHVISTADPYDTLEEETEDESEIDVEHVSSASASEFLGCMSFGVQNLLKKDLDGWYYLLTEEVGRKKHLQAHTKPVLTVRSQQNIPQFNKAVDGQERIVINIPRGKNGFGFSFVDELPPKVGRVDRASPAEQAGVKKGDLVIKINGQNVSRSTSEGVAHLVRKMNPQTLILELQRDHVVSTTTELTAAGIQHSHHPGPYNKRGVGTSTDHLYESITEKMAGDHKENRAVNDTFDEEEEDLTGVGLSLMHRPTNHHPGITSTPRPMLAPSHKTVNTQASHSMSKHEAIHRLMSLELDYIDFMHYGIERYSRPLRHCIVSAHQHITLFQNVEKLVTISEYHIKQMQDNNSSVNSDTDDSQSGEISMFPNSIALIYQSKIHMLCQAYETYANGLVRSNEMLKFQRKNKDFMNFIKEPASEDGQPLGHPSISAFINRPVQHIQDLCAVMSELFAATPLYSPDFANLQQIVVKLSQSVTAISSLDSAGRVQSLDSLTSSQGRTNSQTTSSGKGSMGSLSSTCSSSEADAHRPLMPLPSATSVNSVDRDMIRIQKRLIYPPSLQDFELCQADRHLIYQGDIYRCHKGSWFKSQLLLFSDLLLLVDEDGDGTLIMQENPISMPDLAGIEINRKHASEFVLHLHAAASAPQPRYHQSNASATTRNNGNMKTITLRAPSSQEKFVWKSLLDQRVSAISGSRLQHCGSMKDISNVKTSVVL